MSADCENCSAIEEQNRALKQHLIADHDEREALVNRLVSADKTISGLKGQLTQLRTDNPKMKDAEEVFRFWQLRLGKSARVVFGPERQKKVLARLAEKSSHADVDRIQDLKWAVRGLEALPFVGGQGRQAAGGRGARRHDDLTLVCRDETVVERFCGYADEQADGAFKAFVGALWRYRRMDLSEDDGGPFHVASWCPVCKVDWALCATPGRAWSGDLLWVECVSGCTPDSVRATLRGDEGSAGLKVAA